MYEEFFGLRETPFSVQPDPRYAYPSVEHKIAVAKMRYAVDGKRGLAVLTGPVGIGKCLGRGTPVLMHDGTVRAVEDVRIGDRLMGPDSDAAHRPQPRPRHGQTVPHRSGEGRRLRRQ